jgi:hypothetical protein
MADRQYLGGMTDTVLHFENDGSMIIEERQDCQSILDKNAIGRNERFDAWSPEGTVREEFNIPMVVLLQFEKECGHRLFSKEYDEYMDKKLRQSEFSYLISAPTVRDPHIIIRGAR